MINERLSLPKNSQGVKASVSMLVVLSVEDDGLCDPSRHMSFDDDE